MSHGPVSTSLPSDHPSVNTGKIGLLLINLGTPEATSYWPMRRYLKEFLSDRRVIEVNRVVWWVILNGVILTTRPRKSGHAYDKIWNRELNESPLKTITRSQAKLLDEALRGHAEIVVDWAMRYGFPAIGNKIRALREAGCDRILLFPLYPQYCAATTATALDKAFDALKQMRWQPAIRTVPPYYNHAAHIAELATSLDRHLKSLAWKPDHILVSFHGLPQDYVMAGDPYLRHCMKTAQLLSGKLNLQRGKLQIVFQSRFGRAEWLKPYAKDIVESLPGQGVKKLVVIMPGFAADCVETLEEVAIGLAETFREKGGAEFSAVPCLNDSPGSIRMLETIVREELAGWIE